MAGTPFKFSLDRVLKVRRREAEGTQRVLARRQQDRKQQEARVAEARRRITALNKATRVGSTVGPLALRQDQAYRAEAQRVLGEAERALTHLQTLEDQARQDLLARRHAEEALNTLADQERTRHHKAQDAALTSLLDEQALTGFRQNAARRTGGGAPGRPAGV